MRAGGGRRLLGLTFNRDFFAGYSPERANPGDRNHRLANIVKVTSGSTPEVAEFVDALYRQVVEAGTHRAGSIRVAEAAKVIENTQRDLNIALVNEFSLIFQRLGVDTAEVLAAAGTKWNFLNFRPGLVGGHCIGVDPYYLTHKVESLGYHPAVILAGRQINDAMGPYVAGELVKAQMTRRGAVMKDARASLNHGAGCSRRTALTCGTPGSSTSSASWLPPAARRSTSGIPWDDRRRGAAMSMASA